MTRGYEYFDAGKPGIKRVAKQTKTSTKIAPTAKTSAKKRTTDVKKRSVARVAKKSSVSKARAKSSHSSKAKAAITSSSRKRAADKKTNSSKSVATTPRSVTRMKSTTKRLDINSSSSATLQDPIQFSEESRPLPKTRLTDSDLQEFKKLLLAKRRELAGDLQHLSDGALSSKGHSPAEQSSMPIHMADLGSDNWEREFTLGLLASEQALVREIDDALVRIEDKTYGVCLGTRKRIKIARLRAKPWAKYCIDYARAREEGRAL